MLLYIRYKQLVNEIFKNSSSTNYLRYLGILLIRHVVSEENDKTLKDIKEENGESMFMVWTTYYKMFLLVFNL